jgi:hypothetical protein
MYIEKVQYALIYRYYKYRIYKHGKGYIWRANQVISIALSGVPTGAVLLCTDFKIYPPYVAIIFAVTWGIMFSLLEKNVSKRKLFRHRVTFINMNKYLRPFYITFFIWMMIVVLYKLIARD